MRAMVLKKQGQALELAEYKTPAPGPDEVLVRVMACGVCRTDLHVVDGDLTHPKLPLIPGHEIIGIAVETGSGVNHIKPGDSLGIPWLGKTCGRCSYCVRGDENLCDDPLFTGYTLDGGYAEYAVADQRYCFKIDINRNSFTGLAPWLCAGLIGYRSLKMAGQAQTIGLYGFGAAAHIITQVARWQGRNVFAFTRPGDFESQRFARSLGAVWAGGSDESPPERLDAGIIFAPVGSLIPMALKHVRKKGVVVCAGIHMSDIPSFPYSLIWEERRLISVANLTRADGAEFLEIAAQIPVQTHTTVYPLEEANTALDDLRNGNLQGAAVLVP